MAISGALAAGSIAILATHYEGKELNSPNDIVVRSDGRIYFIDPSSPRSGQAEAVRPDHGLGLNLDQKVRIRQPRDA